MILLVKYFGTAKKSIVCFTEGKSQIEGRGRTRPIGVQRDETTPIERFWQWVSAQRRPPKGGGRSRLTVKPAQLAYRCAYGHGLIVNSLCAISLQNDG